jgi:hypothetical protein
MKLRGRVLLRIDFGIMRVGGMRFWKGVGDCILGMGFGLQYLLVERGLSWGWKFQWSDGVFLSREFGSAKRRGK